ncbi:hypothetical protein HC928_09455 [bacterium]|nr:hypothetical protein [bacterium]
MHALHDSSFARWGGGLRMWARYAMLGAVALLLMLPGGLPPQAVAQEGSADTALVLREPGPGSVASSVRLAVAPDEELPVLMRQVAGTSFGTDTVAVEAWNGSSFEALTTNGLLDPETNLITSEGIDLAFDANGVLYAALNREFPDEGAGEARTLVTRFDAGGWVQVGQPLGRGITIGPLYLFDAQTGLTLVNIESGEDLSELRARSLDAGDWIDLDVPILNIDPEAMYHTLC